MAIEAMLQGISDRGNRKGTIVSYPGGKNGAGVYQTLINLIPPHETYIETHLGGGAVMKHKRPAKKSIGIDADLSVVEMWRPVAQEREDLTVINGDAHQFLRRYDFTGNEFVYCDPPYLMETRKSGQLYLFEYDTGKHIELLQIILDLPCRVMISGYWSQLYADHLQGWSVDCFEAQTRGASTATEYVWFNYAVPVQLHDYSFLGDDFRERERIKRKKQRWVNRLAKMPLLEQRALLNAIDDVFKGLGPSRHL
jgi:DNA adenine methylase